MRDARSSGAAAGRRSGARATRRATASGCGRRSTTATPTWCCSSSSRKARAPATPVSTAASTARSVGPGSMLKPSREDFRKLAADHSVVPVWLEVVADLVTPVAAFTRCVGDRAGFLFESVEHGERWSRWSFMGRDPSATIVARGRRLDVTGVLPPSVPRDRGVLAAVEALLQEYRSPALPDLPPLHGGVVGYLGYDVVREIERLPDVPPDDLGRPDAILSVIGSLAAFDHWRQRVTLIESVVIPPGATEAELDALYDDAGRRIDQFAADGSRPVDEPLVEPPSIDDPLPEVVRCRTPEDY